MALVQVALANILPSMSPYRASRKKQIPLVFRFKWSRMKTCFQLCLGLLFLGQVSGVSAKSDLGLTFSCAPENDLFVTLGKSGRRCSRYDSPDRCRWQKRYRMRPSRRGGAAE